MWLEPKNAARCLKGGKKNGFLVSADPTDHPRHTRDLLSRMQVAEVPTRWRGPSQEPRRPAQVLRGEAPAWLDGSGGR